MDESDQEMSEEMDSDNDAWSGAMPGPDERTEQCKVGKETLQLPELFLEKRHILMSVLSTDTWDTVLTDDQKQRLEQLLPSFPSNDGEEKRETIRRLFNGENFKFGNPVEDLQRKLREGYLHPEIARYRKQTRLFRYRDYKMRQQRHLSDLLKHLLLARQGLFEHASTLAPGEPIKFQYIPPPKKKASPLEQTVKKKTSRILKEVREECGVPDTSSEEDDETSSPVQRSRRQLFKSLGPIPSPEPTLPSVVSTFASKPSLVNGDLNTLNHISSDSPVHNLNNKRARPISPVEVTEERYKLMLKLHKKKKVLDPELPELDTSSVTLQDILSRCQANKKNVKMTAGEIDRDTPTSTADTTTGNPATMKKRLKLKAKGEKKKKLKVKDLPAASVEEEDAVMPPLLSTSELDQSSNFLGVDEESEEISKTVFGPASNFFCLLKSILSEFPDSKCSTPKIEDRVREWLDLNDEISNPWLALQKSWVDHVVSALKFLSGSELGLKVENFVPLVDYKERAQQWKWIGIGRDSDPELSSLFRYWLQHKDDVTVDGVDSTQGSPPPPKAKTSFIVRPTSNNEKALFREQERRRFAAPHKAFTFMMHGYDSVVGPVKGVYDKDSGANKAREHNLLVSDRPPFVTILTLVRDAAARLPNGEGTRGDICELLKDSQFLAPGVTETQINAVVSGALDRLHSEKDPCVKYDVTRKLWIYLHRNRTEDEFERIHQAQAAAVKAKKTLTRPKAGKVAKELSLQITPVAPVASAVTTPTKQNFTLSTLPTTTAATPVAAAKTPTTESTPSSLLGKGAKQATSLVRLAGNNSTSITLSSSIAQLQAARAAMAKSANTVSQLQTIKQLTAAQNLKTTLPSATTTSVVTTSVLTVTSVGLSVNSSLAAQLLYSPGLTQASMVAGKLHKPGMLPTSTATTFSLVTTMNASQSVGNTGKTLAVPTISMLQNQQILKQQQAASQSVLKQNAALVAAVGQTVAAATANSNTVGKLTPAGPKQTFTMTARQTPPPNVVVTKNQAAVNSLKSTGMKQASLILAQDGLGNLTQGPAGKLVALTSVPGALSADGTVMAQIMQQAATNPGTPRGVSQSIRLHGGSLVQSVIGGKPVQISGKPFAQAKGLIQLAGKGGQPIGLIRAPQGSLSTINLIPHSAVTSALSSAPGKTATVLSNSSSPSSLSSPSITTATPTATAVIAGASKGAVSSTQAKMLNPPQAGLMVTQLAQGNITLRAAGTGNNQTKVIPTGTASLVPTQFILHHAPGVSQASSGSLIVSNAAPGVKGGQNLQMVRTVLSQSNLKPGQATILISQPALPQGVVTSATGLTAGQVVQQSSKTSGRGSPKGKPVYARIITPPPGMKLPNLGQVPVSGGNVNMLQTVLVTSALLNPSTVVTPREETLTLDKLKQDGSGDS
uniref:DEUBAD domain-containing protein n=1 Tax=Biomphalaria glabrata TaxID=6526 RepID=A0A2C9K0B7_BIOGL